VIGSTRSVAVWACATPIDMRWSFDRLYATVVHQLGKKPLSGDMFVFVARSRKRAKVMFWDGTGLCIFQKRLEKGRFFAPWKTRATETLRMSMSELSLFLEGSELEGRLPLSPSAYV
jgi:transposase